jgi:hypothetical protein
MKLNKTYERHAFRIVVGIMMLGLLPVGSTGSTPQELDSIYLSQPSFLGAVTSGDFNGDGLADVVVGNPIDSGKVYVYYGKENFSNMADQILTDANRIGLGYRVSSADINNDGFDDLAVAMYWGDNTVYIYMGTSEGLKNTPDLMLKPPTSYDPYGFGQLISVGGDINGDKYSDVLITGGGSSKYVCIYYGSASGISNAPNKIITYPAGYGGGWGVPLSIFGDMNADGFDDMAVSIGGTHIYRGSSSGPIDSGIIITGGMVAKAGDLNKDGYDDLLIGNDFADGIYEMEGKAYIFYGSPSGLSSSPNLTFDNPNPKYDVRFGTSLDSIGDFNYDGFDDIVIGTPYDNSAYVYYGSHNGVSNTPNLTLNAAGYSVSHVGDIKGNGQNFIAIGCEFGGVYLYAMNKSALSYFTILNEKLKKSSQLH